nr:EOG090X07BN [Eurycercus lamellatus]
MKTSLLSGTQDGEDLESCKLNGHVLMSSGSAPTNFIVNGCNGSHSSSGRKSPEAQTSSPKECSLVQSETAVKVLGESLTKMHVDCISDSPLSSIDKNTSPAPLLEKVTYVQYQSELQMPDIMRLIQKDLSEPYSIYTYRYFIHNWPMLCYLAMYGEKCVGAIVCKLDIHKKIVRRGYIAMLAVDEKYRQEKIGSNLVMKAIAAMVTDGADEVVLETEITNEPALRLYENLGFVRDKRLFRYYLNGVDALRLKLWLR